MKKVSKIILAITVLAMAGFIGYFGWKFFVGPEGKVGGTDTPVASVTRPLSTSSAPVKIGGDEVFLRIGDEIAFDFWVAEDTGDVYYITPDGRVFKAGEGQDVKISSQVVSNLITIKPSPRGEKALAVFGDKENPTWAIFDVQDNVWRPMSSEVRAAAWGETENEIVATAKNGGDLNLVKYNLTKTPFSTSIIVKDLKLRGVDFEWHPPSYLIFNEIPSASVPGRLWRLDLKKTEWKMIAPETPGLIARFSGDGTYGLRFSAPGVFTITDANLNEVVPSFLVTLPDKCVFAGRLLYCFAPQNIPQDVTLPDDYFTGKFMSVDSLYAIVPDLGEMEPEPIFQSGIGGHSQVDAIRVSFHDGKIYLLNRYDGLVYRLQVYSGP